MTESVWEGKTSHEMNTALTPGGVVNSHLIMDEIHSFVLRVNLNPAPDGRGAAKPNFKLEYVNEDICQRMQSLDDVLAELTNRIQLILKNANGGLN